MRLKGAALLVTVAGMLVSTLTVAHAQNNVSVTVQQVTVNNNGHDAQGCVDYATGKIWVTGMGVPADGATSNLQRKATARTAARDDALRNLVAIIAGVNVSNETRTVMNKLEKDIIETGCKAFIRAGKMVDNPNQLPAGVDVGPIGLQEEEENGKKQYLYIVAMEVPLYGSGSSAAHAVLQNQQAPQTPAAMAQAHPNAPAQYQDVPAEGSGSRALVPAGVPTGLIVDCTGLAIKPAMAPVIFNQENKTAIYPTADVPTAAAVEKGVVGYVTSMDAAKKLERVGARPIVVRAVAMPNNGPDGKSFDVVVSAEDAKAIKDADAQGKFLANCGVVFVLKP